MRRLCTRVRVWVSILRTDVSAICPLPFICPNTEKTHTHTHTYLPYRQTHPPLTHTQTHTHTHRHTHTHTHTQAPMTKIGQHEQKKQLNRLRHEGYLWTCNFYGSLQFSRRAPCAKNWQSELRLNAGAIQCFLKKEYIMKAVSVTLNYCECNFCVYKANKKILKTKQAIFNAFSAHKTHKFFKRFR